MAELLDGIPTSVLAIYAHPDDPDVSCGGTLARWAADGSEVHVAICARGDKGSADPRADPVELAAARAREATEAARVLGVSQDHFLDHADGTLGAAPLVGELVAVLRKLRPEVVVCPDPQAIFFGQDYFNHSDHRAVGWAALDAVAPASALP
ncbi:MAG: PIG-L deacetylase family protein, partial [Acidimicrobiales bacterium]